MSTKKPSKQEYICKLIPVNPQYGVSINVKETIKRIRHFRAPYFLIDNHDIYGYYHYEDAVTSLNKLLDVIAPMPSNEYYADEAIIEQATWFFLSDTTRNIVIQHAVTRTDNVFKLCRLVIASFGHTYSIKPMLVYNAICTYALCLILGNCVNKAVILLENARYMYNKEYEDEHELLVLIYRMLTLEEYPSAYPADMSIQDKCARLITDMRGGIINEFDENMHQMMSDDQ